MNEIKCIDIAGVDCWIVYLMPFSEQEKKDYDLVLDFQNKCIEKNVFGMGWSCPCLEYGAPMSPDNEEKYRKNRPDASGYAVDGYKAIKKGDYVITRLKDGHYYVGCVSSDGAKYLYKDKDDFFNLFSWGGTVDEWVKYSNDQDTPSEIVGRFSQRLHSTIQRIAAYRQRLLVISMYERKTGNKRYSIPKIKLIKNNFVRSLNYMELEDLVSLYVADKHHTDEYRLLPSSCKISQQNYEFLFYAKGKKPITCQVKNQEEVPIDHYIGENSYEKIYVFSGKWGSELVKQKREEYASYANIYIISPDELYDILRKELVVQDDFYRIEEVSTKLDISKLNELGYKKLEKAKGKKTYSVDENDDSSACFIKNDGLFYSDEFESLILSWDVFDKTHYNKAECINEILTDLNQIAKM